MHYVVTVFIVFMTTSCLETPVNDTADGAGEVRLILDDREWIGEGVAEWNTIISDGGSVQQLLRISAARNIDGVASRLDLTVVALDSLTVGGPYPVITNLGTATAAYATALYNSPNGTYSTLGARVIGQFFLAELDTVNRKVGGGFWFDMVSLADSTTAIVRDATYRELPLTIR